MKRKDSRRQNLRKRIARAQAQPRSCYGPELKREIAAYTETRQSQGGTLREIAMELGLSHRRLGTWMRHVKRRHEAGKLPFKRGPLHEQPMPGTTSPAAAPADSETAPQEDLWLVVRAEHVHMTAETRETLLRYLSTTPPATPTAAKPPRAARDSR